MQWFLILVIVIRLMFWVKVFWVKELKIGVSMLENMFVCRLLFRCCELILVLMILFIVRMFVEVFIRVIMIMMYIEMIVVIWKVGMLKWNGVGNVISGFLVILEKLVMLRNIVMMVLMIIVRRIDRCEIEVLLSLFSSSMMIRVIVVRLMLVMLLKFGVWLLLFIVQCVVIGIRVRLMVVMMMLVISGGKNLVMCEKIGVISNLISEVVIIVLSIVGMLLLLLLLMIVIMVVMLVKDIFWISGN